MECLESATIYSLVNEPPQDTRVSSLTGGGETANFLAEKIDKQTKELILTNYVSPLFSPSHEWALNCKRLPHLFATFEAEVFKALATLGFRVVNEAGVRFSYGDAIVKLLTEFNPDYKVCTSVQRSSLKQMSFPFLFVSILCSFAWSASWRKPLEQPGYRGIPTEDSRWGQF